MESDTKVQKLETFRVIVQILGECGEHHYRVGQLPLSDIQVLWNVTDTIPADRIYTVKNEDDSREAALLRQIFVYYKDGDDPEDPLLEDQSPSDGTVAFHSISFEDAFKELCYVIVLQGWQ
jgi:hypothetical protein